jgi:hypothetical protein
MAALTKPHLFQRIQQKELYFEHHLAGTLYLGPVTKGCFPWLSRSARVGRFG